MIYGIYAIYHHNINPKKTRIYVTMSMHCRIYIVWSSIFSTRTFHADVGIRHYPVVAPPSGFQSHVLSLSLRCIQPWPRWMHRLRQLSGYMPGGFQAQWGNRKVRSDQARRRSGRSHWTGDEWMPHVMHLLGWLTLRPLDRESWPQPGRFGIGKAGACTKKPEAALGTERMNAGFLLTSGSLFV